MNTKDIISHNVTVYRNRPSGFIFVCAKSNSWNTTMRKVYLPLIPTILFKDSRCKIHRLYILNTNKAIHQSFFGARQIKMASVPWLFDNYYFVVIHNNITDNIFLFHTLFFLSRLNQNSPFSSFSRKVIIFENNLTLNGQYVVTSYSPFATFLIL